MLTTFLLNQTVSAKIIENIFLLIKTYQANETILQLIILFLHEVAEVHVDALKNFVGPLVELTVYLVSI